MQQTASVFQYQSARQYLKDTLTERKKRDSEFSIRRFSRQSEVGSHALLVMILNGKRNLTLKQAPAFAKAFGMNSLEHMYFKTLIQLDNARSEEERNLCKLWLNDLNPRPEQKIVEVEQYHLIANWIHMAILTLAKIEGAKISAENVYSLVSEKVPISECRQALDRLIELGMLVERDGRLIPAQSSVRTPDDVANRGSREYHKQVMKLAAEAIEEQDPLIREFQSFALTVPAGKIPLAKEMIRKFRSQLVVTMESEPGVGVYQCNVQFFRLTESPLAEVALSGAPLPAENEGADGKNTIKKES